jgi:hypothetical protein
MTDDVWKMVLSQGGFVAVFVVIVAMVWRAWPQFVKLQDRQHDMNIRQQTFMESFLPVMTGMKDELCSNTNMLIAIMGKLSDIDAHQISIATAAATAAVVVKDELKRKDG